MTLRLVPIQDDGDEADDKGDQCVEEMVERAKSDADCRCRVRDGCCACRHDGVAGPAEELADGAFYEHTCIALDRIVDNANVTKPATPSQSIHSYTSGADGG
jgi:hypothetical protein